jgi:hypothetical protein
MPIKQDLLQHPGFCQHCFCEQCWTGFYPHAKEALPLRDGTLLCIRKGCSGQVQLLPAMRSVRLRRCANRCGAGA